jgi:hypothetical protein
MHTDNFLGLSTGTFLKGIPQGSHGFLRINTYIFIFNNCGKEPLGDTVPLFEFIFLNMTV